MKFLMVLQHGAMDELLYKDILDQENVKELKVSAPDCNKVLYKIRRVHTSTFATKFFEPPLKTIWYKKQLLNEVSDDTYVVFQMGAMIHVGMRTLEAIKKKRPQSKLILLLVDSIDAHSYSMKYAKRFIFGFDWDLILSFDKADCDKYGFTYMGYSYYSKIDIENTNTVSSDLYYIGANKSGDNRIQILNNVYKKCISESVKCDFTVVGQTGQEVEEGIRARNRGIPYKEILNNLATTNCILELVQSGQNNQTARYMEAVCYNKKLLTNNKSVIDLPFYNPLYIKVFERADEIDSDWVKEQIDVDYGYNNEFSPLKIIQIIKDYFGLS